MGVGLLNNRKAGKLFVLIISIVLINIVILSPGLIGVEIGGGNALETTTGITLLIISTLVLAYGSYSLLYKTPAVLPVKDIKTQEDYREGLLYYRDIKVLKKDIILAVDQLDRMGKKKETLLDVLDQRFDPSELSYKKFFSVITEVENLFQQNVRGMLNKINVFDASKLSDFNDQQQSAIFSEKIMQQKSELYNEYLTYVKGYIGANEEILLKLDKLLLEISMLGNADYRDVEEMPCMKEIDALIKQTKYYK